MNDIKKVISEALPSLTDEVLASVIDRIKENGFESIDDLEFFNPEDDVKDLLKLCHRRRLNAKLKEFFDKKKNGGCESENEVSLDIIQQPTCQPQPPQELLASQAECINEAESYKSAINYVIPLAKLPKLITIQEGVPSPAMRRDIVRVLGLDIRQYIKKPLKKHLEVIAQKLVDAFPKSFQDCMDNKVVGNGYSSILCQLIANCENARRPPQINKLKVKKTVTSTDSYGCDAYLPNLPENETEDTQNEKKKILQNEFLLDEVDEEKVSLLMKETFPTQRILIVEGASIEVMKEQFPFLTVQYFFFQHLSRLLGFDVKERLYESLAEKGKEVLNFISNEGENDPCKVVEMLSKHFNEDFKKVVIEFDPSTNVKSIENKDDNPVTPFIAALGNPYNVETQCIVVWQKAFANFTSLKEALAVWFGAFYAFNLKYPEDCSATMEFIQRVFLDINPEKGSKNAKRPKLSLIHPKVLRLIKDLSLKRWNL